MPKAHEPKRGIILMYYGDSNIPSGWELCNGKSGLPDFENRFPKGSEISAVGRSTKKSSDSYKNVILTENDIPPHSHHVNIKADNFNKAWFWNTTSGRCPTEWLGVGKGSVLKNVTDAHTQKSIDMRPSFFDVRFILNDKLESFQIKPGTIIMLAANYSIPDGWVLCDGTNNTPDSINRLPKGYIKNDGKEGKGGSAEVVLSANNLPKHTHSLKSGVGETLSSTWDFNTTTGRKPCVHHGMNDSNGTGNGDHSNTSNSIIERQSRVEPISLLPLYQKVKFIKLISGHGVDRRGVAALPRGAIVMTSKTSRNAPEGLVLCDDKGPIGSFVNRVPMGCKEYDPATVRGGNDKIEIGIKNLPDHNHQFRLTISKFSNTWGKDEECSLEFPAVSTDHHVKTEKNSVNESLKLRQFDDFPGTINFRFFIKP